MVLPGRGNRGIHQQLPILEFDNCHADGCGNVDACQRVFLFKAPDSAGLHLNMIITLIQHAVLLVVLLEDHDLQVGKRHCWKAAESPDFVSSRCMLTYEDSKSISMST